MALGRRRGSFRAALLGPGLGLALGVFLFGAATGPPPEAGSDHQGVDRGFGEPPWAGGQGLGDGPVEVSLALVLAVVAIGSGVALRRRTPRGAFALVVTGTAVYLALGGPAPPAFVAPALALHALARAVPSRTLVLASLSFLPMLLATELASSLVGLGDPGTYVRMAFALAVLFVPALVGQNRQARAAAARRAREEELRAAAYDERLRMARDIHDVVGHGLSTISLQSGVALHVLGRDPEQARACLEAIRATSASSLAQVRSAIGVLRAPGEAGLLRPAPGLGDLPELVAPVEAAGGRVRIRLDPALGSGADVPALVDQVAYRVAQEALTNAARHAPGADVELDVRSDAGALALDVVDEGGELPAPPVEGHGLRGMRERVEALGGRLEVTALSGGGLAVRARLPLHDPGAARARPGGAPEACR